MGKEFAFSVENAEKTEMEIIAVDKKMLTIRASIEENIGNARSAWSCGAADQVLGNLQKSVDALKETEFSIKALSDHLNFCRTGYVKNETTAESITQSVMSAFS